MGPALGLPAERRTACSNQAISVVQGPACAGPTLRNMAVTMKAAGTARSMGASSGVGLRNRIMAQTFEPEHAGLTGWHRACRRRARAMARTRPLAEASHEAAALAEFLPANHESDIVLRGNPPFQRSVAG